MEIYNIENIGRPYQAIGMIKKESAKFGMMGVNVILDDLQKQAAALGADAVVGFQVSTFSGTVSSVMGFGTAVRWQQQ